MRHFTVDEANALIPTLTPVLEDLREVRLRMLRAMAEVRRFSARAAQNGHGENTGVFDRENDLERIQENLRDHLRYLEGLGIELKDVEEGIVDFPTRMYGRDVYLCWRLGEERVSHWHDRDSGFAGRQQLAP